jgi:hypothetical protein
VIKAAHEEKGDPSPAAKPVPNKAPAKARAGPEEPEPKPSDELQVGPAYPIPTPQERLAARQAAAAKAAGQKAAAPANNSAALGEKSGPPTRPQKAAENAVALEGAGHPAGAEAQGLNPLAEEAHNSSSRSLNVANKIEALLDAKLEALASKMDSKLDALLESKLDAFVATRRSPASAAKASNLLALQPATPADDADTPISWLSLASSEALKDPAFTADHKKRKSYLGIRLDGKDIFTAPPRRATEFSSERAREIGLKISAVETREHRIGGELAERVEIKTNKFNFRIWSSKAGKLSQKRMQVRYAHLNLNLVGAFPTHVAGFFAELHGNVAMSAKSKTYLRKVDLRPVSVGK